MRFAASAILIALSLVPACYGQDQPHLVPRNPIPQQQPNVDAGSDYNVPSGTKVPLMLTQGITSKTAKEGDPVYAQTAFPVTQNNRIVIPAGTYVQGVVRRVVRPGRVKGRAEIRAADADRGCGASRLRDDRVDSRRAGLDCGI